MPLPATRYPLPTLSSVNDCAALNYCDGCERLYQAAEGHVWCPECRAELR